MVCLCSPKCTCYCECSKQHLQPSWHPPLEVRRKGIHTAAACGVCPSSRRRENFSAQASQLGSSIHASLTRNSVTASHRPGSSICQHRGCMLRLELGDLQACQEMPGSILCLYPFILPLPCGFQAGFSSGCNSQHLSLRCPGLNNVYIFCSVCHCWGPPVLMDLACAFLCQTSVTASWGIAYHQCVCHLRSMGIYQLSAAPESDLPSG